MGIQANASTPKALRALYVKILSLSPDIAKAGYTGYATLDGTFGFLFLQPNATNKTYASTFAPFNEIRNIDGAEILFTPPLEFPTWLDYGKYFLTDPHIATNVQDASRLLNPRVSKSKTK